MRHAGTRCATASAAIGAATERNHGLEIANNNPFDNPQHEQTWGHGTQKPIECMRRPIINNSRTGQLIYDPLSVRAPL
jgi:hypothetical protein